MKIDYKRELNPAQLKAVESTEGPYLVIAGEGFDDVEFEEAFNV